MDKNRIRPRTGHRISPYKLVLFIHFCTSHSPEPLIIESEEYMVSGQPSTLCVDVHSLSALQGL